VRIYSIRKTNGPGNPSEIYLQGKFKVNVYSKTPRTEHYMK